MINRRRFLAISAAALATPAAARSIHWQGYAMGAEVSLTLDATPEDAQIAISRVERLLKRCEEMFSLYDPNSVLSELNKTGLLRNPPREMLDLLRICGQAHRVTKGLFDPTVQPLWAALRQGGDVNDARSLIGWERVSITAERIRLDNGQALTLNGIAQGYATDLVAHALKQAGWSSVLVNIGEFYAGGRPWTMGIADPLHGLVETVALKNRAVATSSPGAMYLEGTQSHILNPDGQDPALWSTVSVTANTTTWADALSTAFCHANAAEISRTLTRSPDNPTAICVQTDGTIQSVKT
ncbi:FAD:protein FMN transferase [Ruegeria lacuscaerulensis]|uniref:FAD:protein FMN transferase n=1 Tax=Ruegeria lacuscaerulensis TaxID=55218 RepID=UPI001480FF29|nr:FAD:protein FMN transferase [Ruegeria lacuscaerulensis]